MLVAALVGPFFIDWTIYRSTFETYAERALGHRVTVFGDADLRLLPAPSVSFTDVRVGEAEDPLLVVSRFNMRIELPPLLKGEIRVIEMELDRPHLALSLDEEGRLDWLTAMNANGALAKLEPEDVAFEGVTIRNGALSIVDARSGETHSIDNANMAVSARTLEGPFRATGNLTIEGAPYNVSVATGKAQKDLGLRIKGEVTPIDWPVNFTFDGMLQHSDAAPEFEGDFQIASIALDENDQNGWQAEGAFAADIAEVAVPEFEFRYGPEDKRLSVAGSADLVYAGEKRFEIRAKSKQVDLDRLFAGGPQAPVELNAAGGYLIAALSAVPLPPIDGAISLDIPALVAGGGIVQNVRLDLETMLGGWRVARLAGRMPGRTLVATQGDLGLEPTLSYRGAVSLASEQPGALIGWWQKKDTGLTSIDSVSLEGRLNIVPDGTALNNLRLKLSGDEARGELAYRRPPRSGNAEFSLNLYADRLDLDQIERIAALIRPERSGTGGGEDPAGLDVSVRVRATEVVSRGIDGKGLAVAAEYSDGGVRIDRLFAEDLAGTRLDVSGSIQNLFSAPEGSLAGTLDARDLSGVVALTRGLFPESAISRRFEKAAGSLVPAKFDAELQAAALDDDTDMALRLEGNAGGVLTTLNASLKGRVDTWQDAEIDLSLDLEGPDGGRLLQQLGFDVLPVEAAGTGEFSVSANGIPSEELAIDTAAKIGGSRLLVGGAVTMKENSDPEYRLSVSARTGDLAPLALMTGRVLPVMTGTIPADLVVDLEGVGTAIAISSMTGTLGQTGFEGRLEGDLEPAPGERNRRFSGELSMKQADLRNLTELVLGPDQWFSAGDGTSIWPAAPFGAPLLEGIDLTLQFQADRLVFDEASEIANPKAELRLNPSLMRLDGLSGAFAGGNVNGSLSVRRSDAEAAVSGRLKLNNADLRQIVWRPGNRAIASGTLDLFLEFEGVGRSISAIVTGLSGGGTFSMHNGDFRGLNPLAFSLVTRAVDAGLDLRDDKIREIFVNHMAAGNLPFERVDGTLSLIGGRLSARNVVVDSENAEIFGSGEIDIGTYDLDADFSLKVDPGEEAVTGAELQVGLLFAGSVEAPVRSVDISPFTAYLTLRAFEQEVERVEKLQAEIMERDRLVRELKRQRQANARRERAAEAAALAAEEEQRRQEENQAPGDGQSAAQPQENTGLPKDTNIVPQQRGDAASGAEPRSFTERIRSVLGTSPAGAATAAPNAGLNANRPGTLQPLDPPVSIEDLITRDVGGPLVLPGGASQ